MAGSFSYFRKNQKLFMAAATVLAIFIFVFATAFDGSTGQGGRGRGGNKLVASWDGGSISEAKVEQLVRQRSDVNNVLVQLFFGTATMEEQQYEPAPQPDFTYNSKNYNFNQLQVRAVDLEHSAKMAQDAGISVNPAMVTEYLKHWTKGRASGKEVKAVFAAVGRGDALNTEKAVYATLQKLLLKYHFERSFEDPARVMLPLERWNDWKKVNDLVSVQAAVLPVEDFIGEVPEPSESQLKAFYEEYKDRDSNPVDMVNGRQLPASSPGFAEPATVTLRALKGNLIQWRDKSLDKVTDEAIEKFYEENKDRLFVKSDEESDEEDPETTEQEADGEAEIQPSDEAVEENPTEEEPSAAEQPSGPSETDDGTSTSDDSVEDADAAPEESGSSDSNDTEANEGDTEASEEVTEESESEATSADEAGTEENGNEEPISTEEEEEEEESNEETGVEGNEDAAADGDSDDEDSAEKDPEPETDNAADSEPEDNEVVDLAEEDASGNEGTPEERASDEEADRYNVEYQPLDDELRKAIRRKLAMEIAAKEVQSRIEKAEQKLAKLYTKYGTAKVVAEQDEEEQPEVPALLRNPEPLAKEYGLSFEKIPTMTQREMIEETIIGQTREAQGDTLYVARIAYAGTELFEPIVTNEDPKQENSSVYGTGDWYLIVKTAETPRSVPELADIKDEVTRAWKESEAAKLAQARAEELAAEWNKSQPTFFEFFNEKEIKVETTDPFAWLSFSPNAAGRAAPRLTEAPGLKNAGIELMGTIFSLEDEQAAAALNHDKSVAYVVKIHRRDRTKQQLRTTFLAKANNWLGLGQMFEADRSEFTTQVQERIRERSGFEFNEEWLEQLNSNNR